MVKLNILNMENFLDTVNACIGKVYMLCPNGKKQNINGEERYRTVCCGNTSKTKTVCGLFLKFRNPTDYMNIISYYGGLLICL